ncbi:protein SKIP34 [Nicotiana sylvestris]|uniref:Protein SKIP34 n=1 Tax=Nicotiana sylvestris TaxID=4096 RepID=A0A1U7WYN8_NICSY|nr:PREDICTED: protein SKIP34 [Nicotiana sylvestris]XP_009782431.1 PREDICTED: protein SKIP34 [Nicotiana sylvestris]
MCYGSQQFPSKDALTNPTRTRTTPAANENTVVINNLRDRLAETEARLERARSREAELSRQLEEMKRFVCVMEILDCYLKRRYSEQQVKTLAVVSRSKIV